MKKLIPIISWFAGIAVLLALVAFEANGEGKTLISKRFVELEQPGGQLFLTKEEIAQYLDNEDDSLFFKSVQAINSALLEESLENHPFIAEAEVFSTLDGLLSVHVKQKQASARVLKSSRQFYLDAEGHPFPSSKSYSAKVPVFTGKTDSAGIYQAWQLLNVVKEAPFFENWLAEIHVVSADELELIPNQGNHRVQFGNTANATAKLKKLQAFYSTVVTNENLQDWKTLNVSYDGQLVATKHRP